MAMLVVSALTTHFHFYEIILYMLYHLVPRSEANEDLKEVHKKLASFILNTLSLKATCVSSVNEYFTTLGMLMHHYEERVKSRVETPSSTTASSQSNAMYVFWTIFNVFQV